MATVLKPLDAAETARRSLDQWIASTQNKSLLRFITCGSVDDGKSTLIGRLLYDSKLLLEDQLAALANDSRNHGTQGQSLDFALLVDGLSAEREQGITIDVAYRFFATERRKFIVADTPGHEQYTRNMVTGASTADLAVILVDARNGILTQTRRHSFLVRMLGIRHIVLAVNKMDLVGYDEASFERIVGDYREFAVTAGIDDFTAIPVSGLAGDNVAVRSAQMPWYDGPSLLEHLEAVPPTTRDPAREPLRMAVQWVNRPNQDFRGYAGRIASGHAHVGDSIVVLPAGRRSTIDRIVTASGDLDRARPGQSVTLTFADEIDCSRGDVIASANDAPDVVTRIGATLVWMSDEKLAPQRSYWLKLGTATVSASVHRIHSLVDVNSLAERPGQPLELNDIGDVELDLDRAIPAVPYLENHRLGGFILIDKLTHATVAAGLIRNFPASHKARKPGEGTIRWVGGSARSEWAERAAERLRNEGRRVSVIDEAAVAAFGSDDPVRVAREAGGLLAAAGVEVLVTIEVPADLALPGVRVDPDMDREAIDTWII